MALNFPNSPNVGDFYPTPAIPGVPVYRWDGTCWSTAGLSTLDGAVRYDTAQTLTDTQKTQARSNVYAAPFDALAYSGMQVNGSMDVSQELGTTAITAPGGHIADVFGYYCSSSQAISLAQVADAPPGLINSIKMTVTTPNTGPAAGDLIQIWQNIEGYRLARLAWGTANAQPLSIGFWTKIHRPGMYSGGVTNPAANRSYVFTFTQNAADTWEFKTVTIPGDVTGTWPMNSNAAGLHMQFVPISGTNYQAAPNAWTAGYFLAATGTTNGVAATTDTFQITGLIVLPGIELPSASRAPFIMRPFDQELLICRRYWQKSYSYGVAPGGSDTGAMRVLTAFATTQAAGFVLLTPSMRAAPTAVTLYSQAGTINKVTGWTSGLDAGTTVTAPGPSSEGFRYISDSGGGFAVNQGYQFHFTADARL